MSWCGGSSPGRGGGPRALPAHVSAHRPRRPPAPFLSWSVLLRATLAESGYFHANEYRLPFGREYRPGYLSGASAAVVHEARDDPLYPRRGHFRFTDTQVSLRVLGGNNLVKGFVQ